jgi:hypothetical protein
MRRTRVLWEAYVTRFEDALDRYKQGRLTAEEAGELLGLSGRHFRRQCARFEDDGIDGLRDKRLGRVSERRAPESGLERMRRLYREEYADFTVKHFHEVTQTTRLLPGLHGAAAGAAISGPGEACSAAGQAPQEARAPADAGDDAVPGWLNASLDRHAGP